VLTLLVQALDKGLHLGGRVAVCRSARNRITRIQQ
jgi:hypothetical protein